MIDLNSEQIQTANWVFLKMQNLINKQSFRPHGRFNHIHNKEQKMFTV